MRGPAGLFYGTTSSGGAYAVGTIFKLEADGALTTVHSFREADGANPEGELTLGEDGSFHGTASGGGLGHGVIFRLSVPVSGRRLPDDCNADGSQDVSDAVCFLGFLFLGGRPPRWGTDCIAIPECSPVCSP